MRKSLLCLFFLFLVLGLLACQRDDAGTDRADRGLNSLARLNPKEPISGGQSNHLLELILVALWASDKELPDIETFFVACL